MLAAKATLTATKFKKNPLYNGSPEKPLSTRIMPSHRKRERGNRPEVHPTKLIHEIKALEDGSFSDKFIQAAINFIRFYDPEDQNRVREALEQKFMDLDASAVMKSLEVIRGRPKRKIQDWTREWLKQSSVIEPYNLYINILLFTLRKKSFRFTGHSTRLYMATVRLNRLRLVVLVFLAV